MRTILAGVAGALLPGTGHLIAGRRALGLAILVPTLAIAALLVGWGIAVGPFGVAAFLVAPGALVALGAVNLAVAVLRAAAGLDAARRTDPRPGALAVTVVLVALIVAGPHLLAAGTIVAADETIGSIFAPAPPPAGQDLPPTPPSDLLAVGGATGAAPATPWPAVAASGLPGSASPIVTLGPTPWWSASATTGATTGVAPSTTGASTPAATASGAPGGTSQPRPPGVDDLGTGSLPPAGAPVPWTPPGATPWGDDGRFDLLLLGSDAGRDRWSRRTDVMLLVEVDVASGQVAMVGLPRNLTNAPYPPGPARDASACACQPGLLNEMYVEASSRHPDRWPGATPEIKGIGAVRSVVSEITGRPIDAVLVADLVGVIRVVDAMGGVDITVPAPVEDLMYPDPIRGDVHLRIAAGRQHMDGRTALAYARSRHQDSDYGRMSRQQTLLLAVRDAIGPATILSAPALLAAAKGMAWTDLPREALPSLVELFGRASHARVAQLRIVPPAWSSALSLAEVDRIRAAVAALLPGTPAPAPATAPLIGPPGPRVTPVPVVTPTPVPEITPPPADAIPIGDYRCVDIGSATERLEVDGFELVAITPRPPDAAFDPSWIVVAQDPAPGTLLSPGSGIGVTVAAPGTVCP